MYFNFGVATEAVNDFLSNKPANEYNSMKQFLADDITTAMEAVDRTGRRMNDYQSRYVLWLTRKLEEKAESVNFGNIPRLALNYDMAFLGLLLDALHSEEPNIEFKKCMAHPLKNKPMIINNKA